MGFHWRPYLSFWTLIAALAAYDVGSYIIRHLIDHALAATFGMVLAP